MTGTLLNTAAIIVGSLIGMLIHASLPKKMVDTVFQGIGLFTVMLGISMSLKSGNYLFLILSIISGTIIGELIGLEKYIGRLSDFLQKISLPKGNLKARQEKESNNRFTQGFITATMLYCVGSMSILGAIEEGTGQTPALFYTKSIMDGISSIALASSFGLAILFSSIPVLIYQGSLTMFAAYLSQFMNDSLIDNLTSTGGILLIGLGINIFKIKEINIINMLPSLIIIVILTLVFP